MNRSAETKKSLALPRVGKTTPTGGSTQNPIYPHTPVKVYNSVQESKLEISRDFKGKTIIYMCCVPPRSPGGGGISAEEQKLQVKFTLVVG